jgi:hypothetical protein
LGGDAGGRWVEGGEKRGGKRRKERRNEEKSEFSRLRRGGGLPPPVAPPPLGPRPDGRFGFEGQTRPPNTALVLSRYSALFAVI